MKQCLETHCGFREIFIFKIMPKKLTDSEYKNRIINKFGDKLDLSNVYYYNMESIIYPICRIHGSFEIEAERLIYNKFPCPKCSPNYKLKYLEIKRLGSIKHNNKYKYPETNLNFDSNKDDIIIICPFHGNFKQRINNHLSGADCPICADIIKSEKLSTTTDADFQKSANEVHNFQYEYPEPYVRDSFKINIKCKKHGLFPCTPNNHISKKSGCPDCFKERLQSYPEKEILEYLIQNDYKPISSDRKIIHPYELDIYIPELKKAIEFNGLYWHYSQKHFIPGKHANKSKLCKELGIKLLHIREDLWLRDKNKMKEIILRFLQK